MNVYIIGININKILEYVQKIISVIKKVLLVKNLNTYIINNVFQNALTINIRRIRRNIVHINNNYVLELKLMVKIIQVLIMTQNIV